MTVEPDFSISIPHLLAMWPYQVALATITKHNQLGGLEQQKHSIIVLKARSPASSCGQGGFLRRVVRENLFWASFPASNDSLQFLAFLGLWISHSDLCLHLAMVLFLGLRLHMAIFLKGYQSYQRRGPPYSSTTFILTNGMCNHPTSK